MPYVKADVGAMAVQSYLKVESGARGLELLEQGVAPDDVIPILFRNDKYPRMRQFGIVDASGKSSTFTGSECQVWAGGRHGPNYAIQGNVLGSERVVVVMERTFLQTKGSLASRMYAALLAGQRAGGDRRGKQSAALVIEQKGAGYGGSSRKIDIRVDDHARPLKELGRLLKIAERK